MAQKGEILYHMGEFEQALICFKRCHLKKPEDEEFIRCCEKAQKAVENATSCRYMILPCNSKLQI